MDPNDDSPRDHAVGELRHADGNTAQAQAWATLDLAEAVRDLADQQSRTADALQDGLQAIAQALMPPQTY